MKLEKVMATVLVILVLLFAGEFYVSHTPLGYTESSIVYLAAVIGGGCCWIGINRN